MAGHNNVPWRGARKGIYSRGPAYRSSQAGPQGRVIRPMRTALRRINNSGAGTVSSY